MRHTNLNTKQGPVKGIFKENASFEPDSLKSDLFSSLPLSKHPNHQSMPAIRETKRAKGNPLRYMKLSEMMPFLFFLFILTDGNTRVVARQVEGDQGVVIGVMVDSGSRVGRQQQTAMDIAAHDFNMNSKNLRVSIIYRNASVEPFQSALAAQELIKEKQAQVIIGTGQWQEAALVADVGTKLQIPTISLSTPITAPPFSFLRWPYLLQMTKHSSDEIQCFVDLINLHHWKRVIVIYEDEPFGGDSGSFSLLEKALQETGSEIEYQLALPPSASMSNPRKTVQDELRKLINEHYESRVFIVLHLSQSLAAHLFAEAKENGLTGKESVWLITESVVDSSVEGALGLQIDYSNSNDAFQDFEARFLVSFNNKYHQGRDSEPGFHALRAYDAITAIGKAAERLPSNTRNSEALLEHLQSVKFTGLSGKIYFKEGKIAEQETSYKIMNLVDDSPVQVGLWTPGKGLSMAGNVIWPGGLSAKVPKGWLMPTNESRMRIGIPLRTFKTFIQLATPADNSSGLCIELFKKVVQILAYDLPYDLYPCNCIYSDLIDQVHNKLQKVGVSHSFGSLFSISRAKGFIGYNLPVSRDRGTTLDAAVGDFTVLSSRTDYVQFTEPFVESGLALILPVEPHYKDRGWIFLSPFSKELWAATFGIMIYTTVIVWIFEHRNNPEFRGPWRNQLSAALLFMFSSLFFAQREDIRNSYTKIVLVTWFFVVLILSQSYTADLSSMLTTARLKQNETDIETLIVQNATVGCHNHSFIKPFLKDVLKFGPENIIGIQTDHKYFHESFIHRNITAAFLELPYARLFMNNYCNKYTMTTSNYRFGGFSFVFRKGSPIAEDVSWAILNLTENGTLKQLEETWLNPSNECLADQSDIMNSNDTQSLSLGSFWGLFVFSASVSTLCLLGSCIPLARKYRQYVRELQGSRISSNARLSFARYIFHVGNRVSVENNAGGNEMHRLEESQYSSVTHRTAEV